MYRERGADTWLPFSGETVTKIGTWSGSKEVTINFGFRVKSFMALFNVNQNNPIYPADAKEFMYYDGDTNTGHLYLSDGSDASTLNITISDTSITFDMGWSQFNNGGKYYILACG